VPSRARTVSHTADRIRAEATRLFHAQGFVATTVREIAHACRLTPGAIYNHFSSKEEILFAIVDRSGDEAERAVTAAISAVGGPREQLYAALVALIDRQIAFPDAARVADRDYVFLRGARLDEAVGRRHKLRAVFKRLIDAGVAAHQMRVPGAGRAGRQIGTELAATSLINMSALVSDYLKEARVPARRVSELQAGLGLQLVGARRLAPQSRPSAR
jgi:AcrR family transcriptional regulator